MYRDVELPYLKNKDYSDDEYNADETYDDLDISVYSKRSLFSIYEIHTYLTKNDLGNIDAANINQDFSNDSDIPLPYIVTIDKTTKKVLSIYRNWDESDFNKQRKNAFVQYNYLPGYGVYGIGLAHLIGTNSITLTKVLRQLLDSGSYKNIPGGLRVKGMRNQSNDLVAGVGEFVEVDTNGMSLQEAFMPFPYSEPSQTLIALRQEVLAQCKELASISDTGLNDSKEDIPVGTTLAILDTNSKIQSAVLRSIHNSLTYELRLLHDIFSKTLIAETFYSKTFGSMVNITRDSFISAIKLIPISDPTINSTLHKLLRAESILKVASQFPDLHNMREIVKLNYQAQGVTEGVIDVILPDPENQPQQPPPPMMDPITENVTIMQGNAIQAYKGQAHDAHIAVHSNFMEQNPDIAPMIEAHIKEHQMLSYIENMEARLGYAIDPANMPPEMQNQLAMQAAELLQSEQQQMAASAPPDPSVLVQADLDNKAKELDIKEKIANQKAETDIFKAQLDFEKAKLKNN